MPCTAHLASGPAPFVYTCGAREQQDTAALYTALIVNLTSISPRSFITLIYKLSNHVNIFTFRFKSHLVITGMIMNTRAGHRVRKGELSLCLITVYLRLWFIGLRLDTFSDFYLKTQKHANAPHMRSARMTRGTCTQYNKHCVSVFGERNTVR